MKSFKQYIIELFQKVSPYKLSMEGNGRWTWTFLLLSAKNVKNFFVNTSTETDAFIDKYGMDGVKGYLYEVDYTDIFAFGGREHGHFSFDFATTHNTEPESIYELSFGMRWMTILTADEARKQGWSRVKTKYVFEWDQGTDDDINLFDAGTVSTVLATVMEISREFYKKSKPKAILFGTKENVNPARARIYAALAKRMAKELGGEYHVPSSARKGLANPMMVVFPQNF